MRVLALDLSTKTGWAIIDYTDTTICLHKFGRYAIDADKSLEYPANYIDRADRVAAEAAKLISRFKPDVVVIEETNGSKSRYTQKLLEFIHYAVLKSITVPVKYVNTSDWRKTLSVNLSKDDKKVNAKLAKAKKAGISKKIIGIKGRVTKKHVSVRIANEKFKLDLKIGDNDLADAICVGSAYALGTTICTGK